MRLTSPFIALLGLLPLAQALPSSSPFVGVDMILKRYGIASRSPEDYASQLPALRRSKSQPRPPTSSRLDPTPDYRARTPFDWASIALALHQEYIELDAFNYAITRFTPAEWEEWGINPNYVHLIRFFAQQEEGHSTAFSNMLGPRAPLPCEYNYPWANQTNASVPGFIDWSQKSTQLGESGTIGWIPIMDEPAPASIVQQAIVTESRQQFAFRQLEGLFPVTVWFITGLTQAMHWTILSRWITQCPKENKPLPWPIFPRLYVDNQPDAIAAGASAGGPDIAHNLTSLTYPGRVVELSWDRPGEIQGPYHQLTQTNTSGVPRFAAWFGNLNVTFTPLFERNLTSRTAKTTQPGDTIYPDVGQRVINGTAFIALVDRDVFVTPENLTLLNDHIVAGPEFYQAD
ncbi:hypothetical protein CF328_g8636 [Tilletia controversa]|nr:hypothetical protein CF328_g8636 [Tilletia controversa]